MFESAQDFIRLRTSELPEEQYRATHEDAPEEVWREIVASYPEMRTWVAHNRTVPTTILELLQSDSSVDVRCTVARKRKLPERIQQVLAADSDATVRHALVLNANVCLNVLQKLASDEETFVREAATQRLHSHDREA